MEFYTAVLWDMDGTLIDSEPLHARSIAYSLREAGIDVPSDLHDEIVGKSALMIYDLLTGRFGLQMPYDEWFLLKQSYVEKHISNLAPRQPQFDIYLSLHRLGVPQAIVSSSDRMLMNVCLKQVGLIRPGLVMVSRNDVKEGKPHPEPYLRAAYLLGVSPVACIAVEDSKTGYDSAVASGMQTLFVPPPGAHTTKPDLYSTSDDQLLNSLSGLLKRDIER